jgi:hypothetical protein
MVTFMARSKHVIASLAACAAAMALLACGPARWPAGAGCRSSSLLVTLDTRAAGVAGGSEYLPVDITNTAAASCHLHGYPGVALVPGIGGSRIGGATTRQVGQPVRRVILAPGGTAHAWLIVAAASNYRPSRCRPVAIDWLRVRAPGQRGYNYVQHKFTACADASILTVQPVRKGLGLRGTGETSRPGRPGRPGRPARPARPGRPGRPGVRASGSVAGHGRPNPPAACGLRSRHRRDAGVQRTA